MRGLFAFVSVVCAAAGVVLLAAVQFGPAAGSGDPWLLGGFVLGVLAAQLLTVPIARGSQIEVVGFEEAIVVPMVLLLHPADALVVTAAGVLGSHVLMRTPAIKTCFNAGQMMLATGAALAVVWVLVGPAPGTGFPAIGAALAGLVAMFVINQVLVAGVLALASGESLRRVLLPDVSLKAGLWCTNAALGLLLVLPVAERPVLALAGPLLLLFLHRASHAYVDRAQDERRLRELREAAGAMVDEQSVDRVATKLVHAACDLAGARAVELRLRGDERRFWARREDGIITTGVDVRPSEDRRGTLRSTVPLATGGSVVGEVAVYRNEGVGGARRHARRDRTSLEMLASYGAAALEAAMLAARNSRERRTFGQVFEHSSEGLIVLSGDARVLRWNPAMVQIAGFPADAVVDSPIALISPQLGHVAKATTGGSIEATMATADGGRREVRASYARIDDDHDHGDGAAWVVVVRDVTRERETERIKDDFVATVSHELRTPLTAIRGFLETMQRDDVELSAGQVGMFLEIMGEQSTRLERMINDLLDVSALESGRPLRVSIATVELGSELRKAVETFRGAHDQMRVEVIGPHEALLVEADADRFQQVLINLLENARKHAGSQPIEVTLASDGVSARVTVRDRGPGIPAADLRHIFDRFYVTADSVTRAGGGAGLGLYICRSLLTAMHGTIDVQSVVGEGSAFTVSLPVTDRAARIVTGRISSRPRGLSGS